jgi:hypothetical protein
VYQFSRCFVWLSYQWNSPYAVTHNSSCANLWHGSSDSALNIGSQVFYEKYATALSTSQPGFVFHVIWFNCHMQCSFRAVRLHTCYTPAELSKVTHMSLWYMFQCRVLCHPVYRQTVFLKKASDVCMWNLEWWQIINILYTLHWVCLCPWMCACTSSYRYEDVAVRVWTAW